MPFSWQTEVCRMCCSIFCKLAALVLPTHGSSNMGSAVSTIVCHPCPQGQWRSFQTEAPRVPQQLGRLHTARLLQGSGSSWEKHTRPVFPSASGSNSFSPGALGLRGTSSCVDSLFCKRKSQLKGSRFYFGVLQEFLRWNAPKGHSLLESCTGKNTEEREVTKSYFNIFAFSFNFEMGSCLV